MTTTIGRPHAACYWNDGIVRSLIDAIDASGKPENAIAREAGFARGLIGHWRTGKRAPQALLAAEALLSVIGYEIVIRRKPASKRSIRSTHPKGAADHASV
ncbi:hypothetical protein ACHMW5_13595 [Azospirillum melinis]|uniref:hypothetical protein n=1 Tax=Azospirillum melinis TaxID=328839 RepID=UPI00375841F3